MDTTFEMVEERLREMEARGAFKKDELDEHAQEQLRKTDPDIALEALSQWETSSFKRRNPSACMVSLLKKLNEQGSDLGERGAVEPDVAAHEQAEELLERMCDKIDSSATRCLRQLEPTEALSILTEVHQYCDTIRNPSAFIMSAVKRVQNQGRSHGSRRRDPPRLEQGPYADQDQQDGYGYGGFGYDTDNIYGGDDSDRERRRRSEGRNGDSSRNHRVYGSYDYDSHRSRHDRDYSGYDRSNERDSYREDDGYYRERERERGRKDYVDGLIDGLNVDGKARDCLKEVPEEWQVELLEELQRDARRVRNHSAFIMSNVKRIREGTYRSRHGHDDRDGDGYRGHERQESEEQRYYSYSYRYREDREDRDDRDRDHRDHGDNGYDNQDREAWQSIEDIRQSLDEKAQAALRRVSFEDAERLLSDLQSRNHVRNASAWICAKTKIIRKGMNFEEDQKFTSERSRSPRRGGINLTPTPGEQETAQASENTEEHYRAKVLSLVESSHLLDDTAKAALKAVPGLQGLEVFHEVVEDNASIRSPSDFVIRKCREIAQQNGMESEFLKATGIRSDAVRESGAAPKAAATRPSDTAAPVAGGEAQAIDVPAEWQKMPLSQWLRSVDNGKGFLLKYEEALCNNYDDLEQVMELYVKPDSAGNIVIDQTFFNDLHVEKVGHKRLFEQWFKKRWNT